MVAHWLLQHDADVECGRNFCTGTIERRFDATACKCTCNFLTELSNRNQLQLVALPAIGKGPVTIVLQKRGDHA